jgi:hypothetical protein
MYTVVRFVADPACADATLISLGQKLNALMPGMFDRLDHIGRRFSVSISSAEAWNSHVDALLVFLRIASTVITESQELGVSIVCDTAVEPEDIKGKPFLSCTLSGETLQELARHSVGVTLTYYGSD